MMAGLDEDGLFGPVRERLESMIGWARSEEASPWSTGSSRRELSPRGLR